jgi:Protein of unknown function (DUF5131)
MSTATAIEWTEVTWNPTTGCDRISPGCDHCCALTLAKRLKAMGQPKYQLDGDPRTSGPGFGVAVHEDALTEPLRWRAPRKVFVNSMSDVGHARIPPNFAAKICAVMALTRWHQFQVRTKRTKRLAAMLADPAFVREVAEQASDQQPGMAVLAARPQRRASRRRLRPGRRLDNDADGDCCVDLRIPLFFKLLCTNRCLAGHRAMAGSAVAAAAVAGAPRCVRLGRAAVKQPLRGTGEGGGGCQRRVVPGYGLFLDDVHPAVDFRVAADRDFRADLPRRAAFSARLRAEDAGVEFGDEGDVASLGAAEQARNALQPVILQPAACPARRHPEVVGEPSHVRICCGQGLQHLRRVVQLREHPADVTVGQRDRLHGIKCDPRRWDGQSHPAAHAAWSGP